MFISTDRICAASDLDRIPVTVIVSILLGWFFSMAESGGADTYVTVSVVSAVAFIVLLSATGALDVFIVDG